MKNPNFGKKLQSHRKNFHYLKASSKTIYNFGTSSPFTRNLRTKHINTQKTLVHIRIWFKSRPIHKKHKTGQKLIRIANDTQNIKRSHTYVDMQRIRIAHLRPKYSIFRSDFGLKTPETNLNQTSQITNQTT